MRVICGLLILVFANCDLTAQSLKQGIQGKIFWVDNSGVPSPSQNPDPQTGVQREIAVYEVATRADAQQDSDGFFSDITTKLVLSAVSNADGSFKIKLLPGTYSVFVKEPKGLYANLFDRQNRINPVIVQSRQYTWITITIDYQAAN